MNRFKGGAGLLVVLAFLSLLIFSLKPSYAQDPIYDPEGKLATLGIKLPTLSLIHI